MQINLHLDIGNSTIKWQYGDNAMQSVAIEGFSFAQLPDLAPNSLILVCAVAQHILLKKIKQHYHKCQFFIATTQKQYKQLKNAYLKAAQLGVDRWLNLIAVYETYANKNCLIISFGTATTLDILDKNGQHRGGLIMPSLIKIKEGFKHFNQSKNKVLLTKSLRLANQTQLAWQFGCESLWFLGLYQATQQLHQTYQIENLVITGGYAPIVMDKLDLLYHYYPNLVFIGLSFMWDNKIFLDK